MSYARVQVSDYVDDPTSVKEDVRALAEHCLAADWAAPEGEALLIALRRISDGLLMLVLRECSQQATPSVCFDKLPLMLHRQYVQARIVESPHAGALISFAAVPRDARRRPQTPDPAATLSHDAIAALCAQLPRMHGLVRVDLSGSALRGQQFALAAEALAACSTLRLLHMARCDPCGIGAFALAEAMSSWQLHDLDLSEQQHQTTQHIPLADRTSADALADGLALQTALTRLQLREWRMTAKLDASLQRLVRLRSLDLSHQRQGRGSYWSGPELDEAAAQRCFEHLSQLSELNLSRHAYQPVICNPPASTQLRRLCITLAVNWETAFKFQWAVFTALEHLELAGVYANPTDKTGYHMASLAHLQRLTELHLGDDPGESPHLLEITAASNALTQAVCALTSLRVLRFARPRCCTQELRPLSAAWSSLPLLHTLECDVKGTGTLVEGLQERAPRLQSLSALTLRLWCDCDDEDNVILPSLLWLRTQVLQLTQLEKLSLSMHVNFDPDCQPGLWGWPYGFAPLAQLRELRVHQADMSAFDVNLGTLYAASLTLLELRDCKLPYGLWWAEVASLVHLALLHCELTGEQMLSAANGARRGVLDLTGNPCSVVTAVGVLRGLAQWDSEVWHVAMSCSEKLSAGDRADLRTARAAFESGGADGRSALLRCGLE